ncbi:outer membrane autotransporter [Pyronema omphalodes]|nr:outer membrane autotransporter [Pyronema omphalodes]
MKGLFSLVTAFLAAGAAAGPLRTKAAPVAQIECAGKSFTYESLAGYGRLPGNFVDKYGDTMSIGSGISITEWKPTAGGAFEATMFVLPDRGWNTEGTTAYQPRVHKLALTFTPTDAAVSAPNIDYTYVDTILLTDPAGNPVSGLDPNTVLEYAGFPAMPAAAFPGDGFGGEGPGGVRVALDSEGLVVDRVSDEEGFWISDEYGPFLYHFNKEGEMTKAVRPPNSLIPIRNGKEDFGSNNPPRFDPTLVPSPEDPTSGRANNQGFEGLTYAKDENALYTLLQSATINNGGTSDETSRYSTLLKYQLDNEGKNPVLVGEWTVPLPQYTATTGEKLTAAQSSILSLGKGRFMVIARDGDAGRGQDSTESIYRHVDIFSISEATNFIGQYDDYTDAYAPGGVLDASIKPAEYCSFLDINNNSELAKFGLFNGGPDNNAEGLLNEKWEGLSMVPAGREGEYYLFVSNDNDFITQDGHYNFGKYAYADESGFDLYSQMLVFKVKID